MVLLCASVAAVDWPQWRGPTGDGVSTATGLPLEWGADANIAWRCALPEWGNSTPVVSGNAVFLTSHVDGKALQLLRIDLTTGEIAWTRDVGEGVAKTETTPAGSRGSAAYHKDHNMASPSPVTDGEVVIAHFGNGDLAAYDFDGKQLWKRSLVADHGPLTTWWGRANSPVIHDDLVISVCMQDACEDILEKPSPSYVVAHNKRTGEQVWKTMRMTGATKARADSYITPIFRQANGRTEMIVVGGDWLDAYHPATGKQLWVLKGIAGNEQSRNPVAAGDMIFVGQAKRRAMAAIRATGDGEIDPSAIVWTQGYARWNSPSPVVWKDRLYVVDNSRFALCLDVATGKTVWKARLDGSYRAAPIVADGRIYFLNTAGLTTVIEAGDTFKKLAENKLSDATYASPVVVGKRLLIRGRKALYCIGE
jgi:outer membrane protein assembly factor BamB